MGKKLIIKGADFSENGMRESVETLDKSALFTNSDIEVTAENIGSLTGSDTKYMYIRVDVPTPMVASGTNHSSKVFSAKIDVEGYDTVEVSLNYLIPDVVPDTGFTASLIFRGTESTDLKKVYTNAAAYGVSEDIVESLGSSVVDREFSIPAGTKYLYVTDTLEATSFATHKVILKKNVIE